MKKLALYLLSFLALGFVASCEENPGLGKPQVNPQEPIMTVEGVTVSYAEGLAGDAIDLNNYIDKEIPVLNIDAAENLPEGAELDFVMELAADESFSDVENIDVINGKVKGNDWIEAYRQICGRSPKAKTNYVRFIPCVVKGDNIYVLGGEDTHMAQKSLTVTPVALDIKIEQTYYLIGTVNDWTPETIIPFKHSDKDVYDDPVFTLKVEITEEQAAAGWWWKIVPQSAVDAGDVWATIWGVETNGDESLSGFLVQQSETVSAEAGCIKAAGKYNLKINMEECSYEFVEVNTLYAVGDGCDWGFGNAMQLVEKDGAYVGFAYIKSMVKFTDAPDWDHGNYGLGDKPGTLASGSNDNIPVNGPGLYYCSVNLDDLTYELTPIDCVALIGNFNDWNGDYQLAPNENFTVWTADFTLAADTNLKFRMNHGWDINLGGDMDNLSFGGSDMAVKAGTYKVVLDLSTLPYTCQFNK